MGPTALTACTNKRCCLLRNDQGGQQRLTLALTLTFVAAAGGPALANAACGSRGGSALFDICSPGRCGSGTARGSRGGRLSRRVRVAEARLNDRRCPLPLPPPDAWSVVTVSSSATTACHTFSVHVHGRLELSTG